MIQVRNSFGEAKSVATTLADNEEIRFGILSSGSGAYLIVSEHSSFFKFAEKYDKETLVWVVEPGASKEEVFRRALEQIAYPENWPDRPGPYQAWMQAVAANALTNGGNQ